MRIRPSKIGVLGLPYFYRKYGEHYQSDPKMALLCTETRHMTYTSLKSWAR